MSEDLQQVVSKLACSASTMHILSHRCSSAWGSHLAAAVVCASVTAATAACAAVVVIFATAFTLGHLCIYRALIDTVCNHIAESKEERLDQKGWCGWVGVEQLLLEGGLESLTLFHAL